MPLSLDGSSRDGNDAVTLTCPRVCLILKHLGVDGLGLAVSKHVVTEWQYPFEGTFNRCQASAVDLIRLAQNCRTDSNGMVANSGRVLMVSA